jgi:hypothetical protein
MIYVNNELVKFDKPNPYTKLWAEFHKEFAPYLDETGKLVKPITIKYRDGLTRPDPDNPGKYLTPASKGLKLVCNTYVDGLSVEIRYTKTPPRTNQKTGEPEFTTQSIPVTGGRFVIMDDKDLAFFFWAFSPQNYGKSSNMGNTSAWFIIENISYENKELADKKRIKAQIQVKLYADVENNGLSDESLVEVAKSLMIPNAESYLKDHDMDGLRLLLEKMCENRDRAEEFLHAASRTNVTGKRKSERAYVIREALDMRIINQDFKKRSFFLAAEDGKNEGQALYIWKQTDKDPLGGFYTYLYETNQEMLNSLEERVAYRKEIADAEPAEA